MSDLVVLIEELCEEICDKHCKYSETCDSEGCDYCKSHEGKCYLDDLREMVGI